MAALAILLTCKTNCLSLLRRPLKVTLCNMQPLQVSTTCCAAVAGSSPGSCEVCSTPELFVAMLEGYC